MGGISTRDNNPVLDLLLLGDKTSFIEILSLVRDIILLKGVLSLGDNNPVFEVFILLEDETP